MNNNGSSDAMSYSGFYFYTAADTGWPQTQGTTSQTGFYNCSNGAGAPSANNMVFGYNNTPFSSAYDNSPYAWIRRFHQEEPCNLSSPGSPAHEPQLIGGLPRSESHSQNHAVVNGSAFRSQRALSEDAYATEAVKPKKTKRVALFAEEKKDQKIGIYFSRPQMELLDQGMTDGGFNKRSRFLRYCISEYGLKKHENTLLECSKNAALNGSAFRSRTEDAHATEAVNPKKRKTVTKSAQAGIRIKVFIYVTEDELALIKTYVNEGELALVKPDAESFRGRTKFIMSCLDQHWIEKYKMKFSDLPKNATAEEQARFAAVIDEMGTLRKEENQSIERVKALIGKNNELEEKNKTLINTSQRYKVKRTLAQSTKGCK